MRFELTGQGPAKALIRGAAAALVLALAGGLGACTTIEGTNAMTDFGTFEREVMTSTLQGLGAVEQETKPELGGSRRGPLVMPKQTASLPAPVTANPDILPRDSDEVQINTAGLSDQDLTRLKRARVVDLRSLSGRPLTEEETRQLTARFQGAQVPAKRSLLIPPDEYFTVVNGQDMVCMAENGDIVPLSDKRCPPAVKRALKNASTVTATSQ
jgi:hypothetical protein